MCVIMPPYYLLLSCCCTVQVPLDDPEVGRVVCFYVHKCVGFIYNKGESRFCFVFSFFFFYKILCVIMTQTTLLE